ncbi:MAG: hypothetical protein AMR96_05990 [Candidatus Adiutrix intracellularis]|jgi:hypothetical protein|nr:MAG: hypothetical protein AMR96_05990 [Candidatus Adiutrix intracellularis]MDR2827558.1 hypothetical protein [Candidatus Adiutrix intracellularis]
MASAARKHLRDKLQNLPLDWIETLVLALVSDFLLAGGLDSTQGLYRKITKYFKVAVAIINLALFPALVSVIFILAVKSG